MPIYEFLCENCGKKYATLVGMTADSQEPTCTHCGAVQGKKLVSRVAKFRTEDQRVDALADRMELMGEPDSPAEMRKLVREMGSALDEGMADEMEEMFEADLDGTLEDED